MTNPEHPSSLAHVQTARHLDRHLLKTPWATLSAWGLVLTFSLGMQAHAQGVEALEWQPGQSTVPLVISTPHNDVRKLLRQAKYAPALLVVNKNLETNPRDPQMRFWQAYIFEQLGQPEMALQIYLALTQEYPELAEPHNNLGVLYAIQGDYTKAKASFDAALRANPNYATAHENLGDVLVNLARQAYERAANLGANQPNLRPKIERLKPVLDMTQGKP
jgi:tetratricopeptide (TPR) repeat protein